MVQPEIALTEEESSDSETSSASSVDESANSVDESSSTKHKKKKKKHKKKKKKKEETATAVSENGEESDANEEEPKKEKKKKKKNKKKGKKKSKNTSSEEWKNEQAFNLTGDRASGVIEPIIDSSQIRHSQIKIETRPITRLAYNYNTENAFSKENFANGVAVFPSLDKLEKFAKLMAENNVESKIEKLSKQSENLEISREIPIVNKLTMQYNRKGDPRESVKFRRELEKYRRIYSFDKDATA
jgi:hypothetical protein